MKRKLLLLGLLTIGIFWNLMAQVVTKQIDNIEVSGTQAKFLGKSKPIRDLVKKPSTSKERKNSMRRLKKVPDNFKGRKPGGKSVKPDLEHQGPDPIRQTDFSEFSHSGSTEPIVNIQGLGNFGSPHDPSGDVSDEYYIQAINVTDVGVYDLEGNLIQSFAMNTLWSEFNGISAGDPIILYDENAQKWIITEFTDPANLLIAVSETKDPFGSYNAYSFSTPQFPDYPKYAITPEALVVTTNEEGAGTLHQYFLDLAALYAGSTNVNMIRVGVVGNNDTEAGFYVSTPADWNGTNLPYDNRPITLAINDSSWPGGPAQDQIEIYSFNLDFDTPNNTTVDQTAIITTPFDPFPCSVSGFGFECIPQMGGNGLDGVPEVIMNAPHLRNFGTHESLVFNFITDVTDGQNQSGIRWVELRRTAGSEWELYQEGTLGLNDGLDRFLGSIAMDGKGNIGLAYSVSSANSFAGLRYTGRFASDPLGEMTIDEVNIIEGASVINSGGRFGDYSQLSVTPFGDNTFWFTSEYATSDDSGTRIVSFRLSRDTIDLAVKAILEPQTSDLLTANELVTATITNSGLTPLANFNLGFLLDGASIQNVSIPTTLAPDSSLTYQFSTAIDLSAIKEYGITVFVDHPEDQNRLNDSLSVKVSKLNAIDGGIDISASEEGCEGSFTAMIDLVNNGGQEITSANIQVIVNNTPVDTVAFMGNLAFNQSTSITYTVEKNLELGNNIIDFKILDVNGLPDPEVSNNDFQIVYNLLPDDEFITLVFTTDFAPAESSWVLTYANSGTTVATGDLSGVDASTTVSEIICLSVDSCYIFTLSDSYGDGICCSYGEGNFIILDADGNELINNDGMFGFEVMEEFCPSGGCLLSATITVEDASGENESDGSILVNAANGTGPYQYSIDGGATFQDDPLFTNLAADTYEVIVQSADPGCDYSETVTVNFPTGIHNVQDKEVVVKILPNPTSGVFQVIISNLPSTDPLVNLEIFDIRGHLIQNRAISKYNGDYIATLSLYDYPNGNYFLRIRQENVRILEKIVKID